MVLEERLAELGRQLIERERNHSTDLKRAFEYANKVHARLASALEEFHALILPEAPQLASSWANRALMRNIFMRSV